MNAAQVQSIIPSFNDHSYDNSEMVQPLLWCTLLYNVGDLGSHFFRFYFACHILQKLLKNSASKILKSIFDVLDRCPQLF